MSDPREALTRLLAHSRRGVTANVNDNDRHQADAILAEFLVVPRSDIVGTEYGWRRSESDVEVNGPDLDELRKYIRALTGSPDGLYFEHLTRRVSTSPIPLPEDGETR